MYRRMQLVLVGLIAVVAVVATLGALVIVDRAVENAAREDIEAESRELLRYRKDFKVVSVADAIEFRSATGSSQPMLYLLTRADGSPVVGNLSAWPVNVPKTEGWYRFDIEQEGVEAGEVLARVFVFDDEFPVMVARRLSVYATLKNELIPLMVILIGGLSIVLVVFVVRSNERFRQRVAHMNGVLTMVGQGSLHERIHDSEVAGKDELADLACHINTALDENARLMTGLDAVSQTAAHEINRELSHLRDLAESNEQPDLVESADALLRLLGEILELSKIESSADALMTNVNLEDVVRNAVNLYEDAFDDAGTELVAETQAAIVLGQANLLTNAVANLLNNALRHASSNGRVVVAIEKEATSVTVSVSDDGEGAASEDIREILQRTRQGDVAGYGFGLRFVQAVSIRHGATLRLANTSPGFRVSLTFPTSIPTKQRGAR